MKINIVYFFLLICLGMIVPISNTCARGSKRKVVEVKKSACEKAGYVEAAANDIQREYRTIFSPPASQYGGNANSGQVIVDGKIACKAGSICYGNQTYQYRLSMAANKNKNCSKSSSRSCYTELGKTLAIKFPSGEYLAQFQISHGAKKGTRLGRVKAFELIKIRGGHKCLKEIKSKDVISSGPIHKNFAHGLEKSKDPNYQRVLLHFSTRGYNPIILKTYWKRNDESFWCRYFNHCVWMWQGSISVNPIGKLGRPFTYKRPIWVIAHRRNNIVRLDAAFMTSEEFHYAYNPRNGVVARLSETTFNYYSDKEIIKSGGEKVNCVEFDIAPVVGSENDILREDPLYNPHDPGNSWVLWHDKNILESKVINIGPGDFNVPEKFPGYSQGGGIHNRDLPSQKGWGTLPSGVKQFLTRARDWLEGKVRIGDKIITRKASCMMIDTKQGGWPEQSKTPYEGRADQYAIKLLNYLRDDLNWKDELFSRVLFTIPEDQGSVKGIIKGTESLFNGKFPGLYEGYGWKFKKQGGDPVKNRIDYINTLRDNGVNLMSTGTGLALEFLQRNNPIPVNPIYPFYNLLAEMKNQKDRLGSPEGIMFYTVDSKSNLRKVLDHGPDAIISNWPSRLRVIIESPPYKYYLRMATPRDKLKGSR